MAVKKPEKVIDDLTMQLQLVANDLKSPTTLKLLGISARNQIVKRTRLGRGVENGKQTKLAPLKKSYKDYRAGKVAFFTDGGGNLRKILNPSKKPLLDSTTSPGKSNLTLTGAMLKSIKVTIQGNKAVIGPSGKKNIDKAFWAHEGASNRAKRPFIGLTVAEEFKVTQIYNKLFELALDKRLKG